MELLRGVHLIETYANSYLYADGRLVLIDTSADGNATDILAYLKAAKVAAKDLSSIVITHTHPDHVSGVAAVKTAAPSAKVAAHNDDADYVARTKVYPGPPGAQKHKAVPVDVRLTDGQTFDGFLVIHAPGHTPGNLALLDRERKVLVAGDSLRTEGGLAPMSDQYNIDPKAHRASIKKIATFDFDVLVVGHGKPILKGAGAQVKALAAKL